MFAAIALMILFMGRIRTVFWIAVIPAALSFLLAWLALREPETKLGGHKPQPFFAGFRHLAPETKRLIAVGFLFTLARFSEAFLVLRARNVGLIANCSAYAPPAAA